MSSSGKNGTVNWADFLQTVSANQYLRDESTDTSLQPGEEYPSSPHPYMVHAHKQKHATLNQISTLLDNAPSTVPATDRAAFTLAREEAQNNWLYPYTVENPCGTQVFSHWLSQFNTAVVQIVSVEFQHQKRLSKEGKDLYSTASSTFLDGDPARHAITAKGLEIGQPLLLEHMYCCTAKTMIALKKFSAENRKDLHTDSSRSDPYTIQRNEADAQKYQNIVLAQLTELQAACSHTAQLFLKKLIPGADDETSHLFLSLKNHRQQHYELQATLDVDMRVPYNMHHVLRYIRHNTVRDDAIALHVVEHDMLRHTRPQGMNIYLWCLSFAPNMRRHRHATKRELLEGEADMLITKIFAAQLTSNELETIAAIDKTNIFINIAKGQFDMSALKSLISKNLTRFNRTFKDDRRIHLFRVNHEIRMRGKPQIIPPPKKRKIAPPATGKTPPGKKRYDKNAALLAKSEISISDHCKTPKCIKDGKQHTHTHAKCGFVLRAAGNTQSSARPPGGPNKPPHSPNPNGRLGAPSGKPIKCFFCGGDHMKRDCAKFAKLQTSAAFMAMIDDYEDDEIEFLDLLICTTNKPVCKFCLEKDCNGSCGPMCPAMTSAKAKFFSKGAFEEVLLAKMDRQTNKFGHSPFSRDSYLSSRTTDTSEGTDNEDEPEAQEDISITAKAAPEEQVMQVEQEENPDPGSDHSSVDEDGDPTDQ
jgi:hypothetical protein